MAVHLVQGVNGPVRKPELSHPKSKEEVQSPKIGKTGKKWQFSPQIFSTEMTQIGIK